MIICNGIDPLELSRVHNHDFPIPDVSNKMYVIQKTVIDNASIVGFGMVRLTSEGILILDSKQPAITRARAGAALVTTMKDDAIRLGLDECHVFVKDPAVRKFVERMGFRPSLGGEPLIIHF